MLPYLDVCIDQWRQKLENFEGDGDEKVGVKGGYSLANSSVLAHLDNFARSTFLFLSFSLTLQFFFLIVEF